MKRYAFIPPPTSALPGWRWGTAAIFLLSGVLLSLAIDSPLGLLIIAAFALVASVALQLRSEHNAKHRLQTPEVCPLSGGEHSWDVPEYEPSPFAPFAGFSARHCKCGARA